MNIQDFILIVILVGCVVWIIKRILLCYKQINKESNPCKGCGCGCTVYTQMTKGEKKCVFIEKKTENACGFKK